MAAALEMSGWRAELEQLLARFGRLFVRAEPREQAGRYLEGLLGPVRRKNGWQLAEHLGEDRKSTRLNSSHANTSYAVFCLKKNTQPAYTSHSSNSATPFSTSK